MTLFHPRKFFSLFVHRQIKLICLVAYGQFYCLFHFTLYKQPEDHSLVYR